MRTEKSLNHSVWECKYHVIFISKYRRKVLFGQIRQGLGEIFHELARYKECLIVEGHILKDHVHMLISIPPKYAVSQVVGYLKGKSAIQIARRYSGKKRNYIGQHFWAHGYYVTTVGRDEAIIRNYIRNQETADQYHEQLKLNRV